MITMLINVVGWVIGHGHPHVDVQARQYPAGFSPVVGSTVIFKAISRSGVPVDVTGTLRSIAYNMTGRENPTMILAVDDCEPVNWQWGALK